MNHSSALVYWTLSVERRYKKARSCILDALRFTRRFLHLKVNLFPAFHMCLVMVSLSPSSVCVCVSVSAFLKVTLVHGACPLLDHVTLMQRYSVTVSVLSWKDGVIPPRK